MKAFIVFIILSVSIAFSAGSATTETSSEDAYAQAVSLIEAENYQAAIDVLLPLAETDSQNADVFNWLGYAHRKMQNYDEALKYYLNALELDPEHLGAHEYLGELYIETSEPEKAKAQLEILEKLCPTGCEELTDLQEALAEAQP